VVVDQHILEKPRDHADALRMLRLLSGRDHEVITGICLRSGSRKIIDSATTRVHFVQLTEAELAAYVQSGEPMDKAGAYAIQGLASRFIDRVDGGYFNVVGLPMSLVYRHLKSLGYFQ
jgi:septum formation protein